MNDNLTVSFYQLAQIVPDAESARLFIEQKRWGITGRTCPYCGHSHSIARGEDRKGYYRCCKCRKEFTVRTGSVFERSHIPLNKWIMAIYLTVTARKGVSSLQISKELSITQSSAWFMMHRIRTAMGKSGPAKLRGIIEVDETYLGGKEMNKHDGKKLNSGRGAVGKIPVLGIRRRKGHVRAMVVADTAKRTLQGRIEEHVAKGSVVNTDDFGSYTDLSRMFRHQVVKHSAKQYVDGKAHTNSIESVWALLKRGFYGTFHKFSMEHLQKYVDEFSFRLNEATCKMPTLQRIASFLENSWGKRLEYGQLVGWS